MLPAEVSGHVTGHDVRLEIDDRASTVTTCDGHLERVRDEGDPERAGRLADTSYRQAHAIDRDRPLDGDEAGDGGRQLDGQLSPRRCLFNRPNPCCGVHVTLDK